ncbi:PH domain-containing protein [Leifsonia poae]|uniref:Low molecular weight protein antigen 6 PH domain-containing protein n=1 Tax=Leifsonia poae TaxID=110933 RepID=A0A9W6H9C1_9MICO|nr:PH domain-containing protein [Leifsonia poae]GLJ75819.1 hypothetical protein GCM10017584_13930 [Leifsonia poae]
MPYTSTDEREVFVSRFNRVIAVLIWAGAAAIAVALVVSVHDQRLLYLVPCALFAFVAWAALWQPRLVVAPEGITVHNVERTIEIPWPALVHVDTKYALTLYTPGHRYSVWSAPAPGTASTLRATRNEVKGRAGRPSVDSEARRPGDLLSTESGQAAEVVRRRWTHLRDTGALEVGVADEAKVVVTWNVATIAGVVVLLGGTVAALLLT